jgi:hypothetical protein
MALVLLAAQAAAIIINSLTAPATVRVNTASVQAVIGSDASRPGERVLTVIYPAASANPAARDVQIAAEKTDWSGGQGIVFHAKAEHPMRISISFIDRNHVAYTAYVNLTSNNWEQVAIAFDQIEPNAFFQPPDAKKGSAIDVSDVKFIAFAPQEKGAGQVAVTAFTVVK